MNQRTTGLLRALVLRLVSMTWRTRFEGLEELDAAIGQGRRIIVVFWHQKYLLLLPLLRGRPAVVFTSQTTRGDVIAGILSRLGYTPVQIPDHGRERSLAIMHAALESATTTAIAVDGPLGPYHVVHAGAVRLASNLGFDIVPMSAGCSPGRVLSQRWDKLVVPCLFARVQLQVGAPIKIPANLLENQIAHWAERIHAALEDVDRSSEAALEGA